MAKLFIKLYGERNTGTNYLRKLIHLNLDVEILRGVVPWYIFILGSEVTKDLYFRLTYHKNLGWKHSMAPSLSLLEEIDISLDNLFFVTVTKNPYSWLLSFFRHPYHAKTRAKTFKQFLTTPCRTVGRENFTGAFDNPIVMWNKKNASYIKLNDVTPCMNLRYKDLLVNPESLIAKISEKYSLKRKRSVFKNVQRDMKFDRRKNFPYYRDYYLQERWKEKLCKETLNIINAYLDTDILAAFGYERLL